MLIQSVPGSWELPFATQWYAFQTVLLSYIILSLSVARSISLGGGFNVIFILIFLLTRNLIYDVLLSGAKGNSIVHY